MRKYLLPTEGNWYKANLHTHTNVSDGNFSPERMKEEYKARGYSIIAFTDHNVLVDHSYLADEDFLPLLGWEVDLNEDKPWSESPKTCHICFIALEKENARQHFVRRWAIPNGAAAHADRIRIDDATPDGETLHTPEHVSTVMEGARAAGFFVTYNHPAWSLETREDYASYHGMHAMEICNFGCYEAGYEDYNGYIYDDILRTGNRIYCTATDDNHNGTENVLHDSFGGFTMICAESLDYRTVTRALEAGNFYASMGPTIHELYIEDDTVHIKCSPARRIALHTGARFSFAKWAREGEPLLTEASFPLYGRDPIYFRLDVTDAEGKHANTNAYFTDTL